MNTLGANPADINFKHDVVGAIQQLDKRRKAIIVERLQGKTLATLGKRYKLTPSRISQLEYEGWGLVKRNTTNSKSHQNNHVPATA